MFYGKMYHKVSVDADPNTEVDPAVTHPSVIGYAFVEKRAKTPPPPPPPIPSKDECMWYNTFIFYNIAFRSKINLLLLLITLALDKMASVNLINESH